MGGTILTFSVHARTRKKRKTEGETVSWRHVVLEILRSHPTCPNRTLAGWLVPIIDLWGCIYSVVVDLPFLAVVHLNLLQFSLFLRFSLVTCYFQVYYIFILLFCFF